MPNKAGREQLDCRQATLDLPAPSVAPVLPVPSVQEQRTISTARTRVRACHRRTQLASSPTQFDTAKLHPPHADGAGFTFELRDAFGTTSGAFVRKQIDHITRVVGHREDGKPDVDAVNAVVAMVDGLRPENEVQAALAVQFSLTHQMPAKMLARASLCANIDHRERYINMATKLQRTMAVHGDMIAGLKGKPEGSPQVGPVTVQDGGQAIVGGTVNIEARRGENGG